ncbi:4-nitrophenylphosphatase [Erysipelotrichaceae bacterium]|nr:4-nitrophenylphosphatase [Erysipelotrichaceae bacterium]
MNKMHKYQVYLFDLDGTVYAGNRPIESCISFINQLIKQEKKVVFVTNNATLMEKSLRSKLCKMGIESNNYTFVSSAMVCALYLKNQGIQQIHLLGSDALAFFCKKENIEIHSKNPQAVVVSLDISATYEQIAEAAYIIQKQQIPLIATNMDLRLPKDEFFVPGAGTIVFMVEQAAGVKAYVIGKPAHHMIAYIQKKYPHYRKEQFLMIGDNYFTDITFGIENSIDTCFVETGVHTMEFVEQQKKQPTFKYAHL